MKETLVDRNRPATTVLTPPGHPERLRVQSVVPPVTPCVGICSTTYGDLVCRGCKRFAHEIVQWNGYSPAQRGAVWRRLLEGRDGVVAARTRIEDLPLLKARATALRVRHDPALGDYLLAYEVLRRVSSRDERLADCGLASPGPAQPTPAELLAAIDRELYDRALAHYERNFKIPAR